MPDHRNSESTRDRLPQSSSSDLQGGGVVQQMPDSDHDDDDDAFLEKAHSENSELEQNTDERDINSLYGETQEEENLGIDGAATTCSDGAVLEESLEGQERRDGTVWGRKKGELVLHDRARQEAEAEGEAKVEIAGAATFCSDGAVPDKTEERDSEAETRNGTALEREGERCVEEAVAAYYASGLNGGVCKNQESKPVDCEMRGAVLRKGEMGVSGNEEISNRIDGKVNEQKCCMKIEVVDETALVEFGKEIKAINYSANSGKNVNHKRPRRRGQCGKTNSAGADDENQKFLDMGFAQNCGNRNQEKWGRRVYTRTELEALRFVAVEWQRRKWTEVYCGLGPAVQEEYDGLVGSDNHSQFRQQQKKKHVRVNFDPRLRNEARSSVFGEESSENAENENAYENPTDPPGLHLIEQDECVEDDSDEDYSGIQKPAFFVTGKPDFDSGPPEDGLEYLRRVRWEAAQIPKVKVAKVDRTKLNKEQTVYMPQIPDVAECPVHLMPLKEWEDAFLADFSELRLALSRFENLEAKVRPSSTAHEGQSFSEPLDSFLLENVENMPCVEDSSQSVVPETCGNPCSCAVVNDNDGMDSVESPSSSRSYAGGGGGGGSEKCPALSMVLGMDSVARVSMLRKRINAAKSMSSLCWDDCAWLFALSAAVDSPLDGDTCAAFRSLLRKCASLRAGKVELDDEVAMLNILATISGRYFGQLG